MSAKVQRHWCVIPTIESINVATTKELTDKGPLTFYRIVAFPEMRSSNLDVWISNGGEELQLASLRRIQGGSRRRVNPGLFPEVDSSCLRSPCKKVLRPLGYEVPTQVG